MQAIIDDMTAAVRIDARQIEQALCRLSSTTVGLLRASVEDGTVTLTGFVQTDREKRLVLEQVWRLPGVRQVKDQVEVYYG